MKYFTFTAKCTKHNCDLEYVEPEGFEPDFVPRPTIEGVQLSPIEWTLDFVSRWQCPVFVEEAANAFMGYGNEYPQYDAEHKHWAFVAQNGEVS
jgi:hypothetical protein